MHGISGLEHFVETLRLKKINPCDIDCIAAIGGDHGEARMQMTQLMSGYGFMTRSIIHRSAVISQTATIGKNVQLLAGCNVGAFASIGDYTIINSGANVDHDCIIGQKCHWRHWPLLLGKSL